MFVPICPECGRDDHVRRAAAVLAEGARGWQGFGLAWGRGGPDVVWVRGAADLRATAHALGAPEPPRTWPATTVGCGGLLALVLALALFLGGLAAAGEGGTPGGLYTAAVVVGLFAVGLGIAWNGLRHERASALAVYEAEMRRWADRTWICARCGIVFRVPS